MSSFASNDFAIEFVLRTRLNYLKLLKCDYENHMQTDTTLDRQQWALNIQSIEEEIASTQDRMRRLGYSQLSVCCGTQLMNSVLGLLVIPEQRFFKLMDRFSSRQRWEQAGLSTLARYVFSPDNYESNYIEDWDEYHHRILYERRSPQNVLKHMRNAVSHKNIMFYPEQATGQDDVTRIVFKDRNSTPVSSKMRWLKVEKNSTVGCLELLNNKGHIKHTKDGEQENVEERFKLSIDKNDFDAVLFEISDYFIRIGRE